MAIDTTLAQPSAATSGLVREGSSFRRARPHASSIAVACLVLLPVAVYGVPTLLGHPVLPGDDLVQSLPLRELVGHDLRTGHLPIFDPYLWSGAPLLAGWNAGAAYPLTWIFAVLPASVAWILNVVAVSIVAGTGCYAFLRACRLGVVASFVGGLTYAFGGGMSAQIQHIGLVVGMSWIPVGLLAVLRLTDPEERTARSRLGWTTVLAASVGLVILAGEPRAVANAAVVLVIYGAWRLVRLARRTGPSRVLAWAAATVGAGAVLGLALGAVQLFPGLAAVATSQRAAVTTFLYSAGSIPAPWLLLLGVPDLLGGVGSFGQPSYFASYNLAEVTSYVGVLPLIAAGALVARVRWRPLPEWIVWYAVGITGALMALATHTPLWHLFFKIPLFAGQRLQSRSIMVTDLALAILVAYWCDTWISQRPHRSHHQRGGALSGRAAGALSARVAGTVAPLGIAVVALIAIAWPVQLLTWMGVSSHTARAVGSLSGSVAPFLVLAVLGGALVWLGPRIAPRLRPGILIGFVAVDLVVFSAAAIFALAPGQPSASTSTASPPSVAAPGGQDRTSPLSSLHLDGRFAVYDPTLLDDSALVALGAPDANAASGVSSVQGYGSIAYGPYAQATGTHGVSGGGQDVLSLQAAVNGTLDDLDTGALLAPSQYLRVQRNPSEGSPATTRGSTPGARDVPAGGKTTWFLGTALSISTATLGATGGSTATPQVGALTATGRIVWAGSVERARAVGSHPTPASASTAFGPVAPGPVAPGPVWRASWRAPQPAVALVVASVARMTLRAPLVTADTAAYRLDGALQAAMVAPHWRYSGHDGPFAIFVDRRAVAPLSLHALAGRSVGGASVQRLSGPALDPASALVRSRHGVKIVRAVAYLPGWQAEWHPAGARSPVPLHVRPDGVVQSVTVPAGSGVVTWAYVAPELSASEDAGEAGSACLLALVGAVALMGMAARRHRFRHLRRHQRAAAAGWK